MKFNQSNTMRLLFPALSILAACLLQGCYTSAPTPSAIEDSF